MNKTSLKTIAITALWLLSLIHSPATFYLVQTWYFPHLQAIGIPEVPLKLMSGIALLVTFFGFCATGVMILGRLFKESEEQS
tara:strand:- start:310 stop:555 length:246 start_codon:yes stop_codon:yes gene_type:complete